MFSSGNLSLASNLLMLNSWKAWRCEKESYNLLKKMLVCLKDCVLKNHWRVRQQEKGELCLNRHKRCLGGSPAYSLTFVTCWCWLKYYMRLRLNWQNKIMTLKHTFHLLHKKNVGKTKSHFKMYLNAIKWQIEPESHMFLSLGQKKRWKHHNWRSMLLMRKLLWSHSQYWA